MDTRTEEAWRDATMGSHKDDWRWIAHEMKYRMEQMEADYSNRLSQSDAQLYAIQSHIEQYREGTPD